jgi:hypothetical protein
VFRTVAVGSALAWWGCGGLTGGGLDAPSLRVHTATSGVETDADGYRVAIDEGSGRPIGINASVEFGSLAEGSHTVELLEVAPNCAIRGPHPRAVSISSGSTADIAFDVECRASTGSVRVITRTTGSDQDGDGYVVVVNGEARQVDINGSITYEDVTAGETVVEILSVAPNCSAAGQTYYQIRVTGGETFEITFAFDCSPRQPDTGSLQVTTATSGPSPDGDGYVVTVDGAAGESIAPSGSVTLTGLPLGERSVGLSEIAANCAVSGANPRPASVTGTELVVVAFEVVCTQPPSETGTLRVITSTSGADFDPSGYTIVVDGLVRQPAGVNRDVPIAGLSSGDHSVALVDLTPNCTTTDNPRTVSVPAGGEVSATFVVACIPAFGYITSTTRTSGTAIDADGYVARVNGGAGKPVGPNGAVTRGGLAPGSHTVQLDNVASNCQVQGNNPRTVLVAGYETTTVAFEVLCTATTGSMTVTVAGLPAGVAANLAVSGPEGYARTLPGSAVLANLTPGAYTLTAGTVTVEGTVYRPAAQNVAATVVAGQSVAVIISYQ